MVSTLAGSPGSSGNTNGTGSAARFNLPNDLVTDATGNIYVADRVNHLIRKITPTGDVTTFAGSGVAGNTDGTGTAASFNNPNGIAIDATGNLYIADLSNHRIRKINSAGEVTTLAGSTSGYLDGTGTSARFSFPQSLVVDNLGDIYVADRDNLRISKVTSIGVVTTFVGNGSYANVDGTGTGASFNNIHDITVDNNGNIYVTQDTHKIRKITPSAVVSTYAGSTLGSDNGNGTAAKFNVPYGITCDSNNNLYVADRNNYTIRKISSTGDVSTFAGITGTSGSTNGDVAIATFSPQSVTVANNGNVYVADNNYIIRKIQDAALGFSEINSENNPISIFPNPTTSIITISGLLNSETYAIYDMMGRQLQNGVLNNNDTINLENFATGKYLLKFSNGVTSSILKN
ncbi:MAG: hypothetical protein A3G95_03270 [Flavobacteria bacterium RIFCSPLOWO2_12_FULL_31_7]|nr:MAG: hypothetical protein A3G95_03270 [Flavobacteria bacterium RIFCSPLOWO2_12_FULL_31_7]